MGLLSRESNDPQPASTVANGIEFEETFPDDASSAPAPLAPAVAAPRLTVVRREPEPDVETTAPLAPAPVVPAIADERARTIGDQKLVERIEAMLVEWQARFEARLEQRRVEEERLSERRRRTEDERLRAWRTELEHQLLQRFAERRAPERTRTDRGSELRASARATIASAANARDLGRVVRDLLSEITTTAAFALSVHHAERDEVAYRYRVASEDELGTTLRRETLDDGPNSAVARMDGWVRAHRAVRIGEQDTVVHTMQSAVRVDETTLGVLTLQTEAQPLDDAALARVTQIVLAAAPRLAELRDTGAFRGA